MGDGPVRSTLGRRGLRVSIVGVGLLVFALAGRTLWDQVGEETALVVAIGLGLLLAADLVLAWRALASVVVHVAAPGEAFLGEPTALAFVVHGLPRAATVEVVSVPSRGPVLAASEGRGAVITGEIEVRPPVRGRLVRAVVELVASGPFGLFTCHRRLAVPFPVPMHCAPRSAPGDTGVGAVGRAARRPPTVGGAGDQPRGVRAYRPGDPPRSVHWPATAHHGALVVREVDGGAGDEASVVVVLELTTDGPRADDAVARCRAVVEEAARQGATARLVTLEADDEDPPPFDRAVLSPRRPPVQVLAHHAGTARTVDASVAPGPSLHRRLALAVAGPVVLPPDLGGAGAGDAGRGGADAGVGGPDGRGSVVRISDRGSGS